MFFIALSIFGILVGIFLLKQGFSGDGLGAGLTVIVGLFVTIKEALDIIFAGK